ncbi:class I SAM-dependent methyltransferase [Bradyrhizobium sp. MOS002]|uniref:class I SAM-dependent methyltransferase n=1 Tax=Bradyrhizobium sp. MOS002 TaxID=2133947 RepID=UPI000D132FA4|nr:class I SAM-dependent methyltransferase [Bradyrhizobium sp. MOS002]PSO23664.1 methyltransferase [Bradyrhizobium sp. MOS002]
MDWTAGYVTELEYTYGYYRELCPALLRLACLSAGVAPSAGKPFSYLELGYGQGLSLNVHAAANEGVFWGTDFNPVQTAHAMAFAEASGGSVKALNDSFAELAARNDLPEFDVIALHGIWTWISEENSRHIVDIMRRKLRVGGLVYISYNCFPGWAPAAPLRHLMKLHADVAGAEASGMGAKVDAALAFARQVVDSGALYFRGNPAVGERLKKMSEQNRNYLAHEYFNKDWRIASFSEMAETLEAAKLSFVGSAHLLDHVDAVNLSPDGQKLLNSVEHPILRQSVRDYFVNQQFRRDIFMKGPRSLPPAERAQLLLGESFVLTSLASDVPRKVTGSLGEATLQNQVYDPLIDVLAEEKQRPKLLSELVRHPRLRSLPFAQLVQALVVLAGAGHVSLAQSASKATKAHCKSLNRYLCERSRSSSEVAYLASPVTGGGVAVPRFEQVFLLLGSPEKRSAQEHAKFAWDILKNQGQRMLKGGRPLETEDENLAQLTSLAETFLLRLPVLQTLEIA